MSWLRIVQTISTFITGNVWTTLVIIAVAIAGARDARFTGTADISGAGRLAAARSWYVRPGWSRPPVAPE